MNDDNKKPPLIDQIDWAYIQTRLINGLSHLAVFMKNPVEGIKKAPAWDWPTAVIVSSVVSAVTGILNGIVDGNILGIITGFILKPFYGVIISGIIAGVLYYACMFLLNATLEFKKLFIIVILAFVPGQILSILTPLFKPVHIAATMVTAYLTIVGLSDNFLLDRKRVTKIIGILAGAYILIFTLGYLQQLSHSPSKARGFSPETLDQIARELESK